MEKYKTPQDLIFGSLINSKLRKKHCLIDSETGRTITYGELNKETEMSAGIIKSFNINRGDTVSLLLENGLHFFLPWLGAIRLGAVAHPINCLVKNEDILYALELCRTKLLITQERYVWNRIENKPSALLKMLKEKFPELKIIAMRDPERFWSEAELQCKGYMNLYCWHTLKKFVEPYKYVAAPLNSDPFQLICTSGTTGKPKAVVQHCGMFEPNITDLIKTYGFTKKDRTLLINRLFHVNAQVTNFFPMVLLGGTTVLCPPEPEKILKTILERKITYSSMIPPTLLAILNYHLKNGGDSTLKKEIKYMRFIIAGADILSSKLHKAFTDNIGITVLPGWGMTETLCWGSGTAVSGPNYWGSIGRALPHMEVKIVDPENNWKEIKDNLWGRLIVRGDNVFKEYYRNHEATKKAFAPSEKWGGGWFDTGDTCRITYKKTGAIFFGWRASADSWKVRGEFVQGPAVDECVKSNPVIEDAMSVPVTISGETETALCVVLKAGLFDAEDSMRSSIAEAAISLYCEQNRREGKLDKHIKIRNIIFVEKIELGDTGKRSRKKMAEIAQKYIDLENGGNDEKAK